MAPSIVSLEQPSTTLPIQSKKTVVDVKEREVEQDEAREPTDGKVNKFNYIPGWVEPIDHTNYAHEDLLPSFPDVKWPPLTEVPYEEKGLLGDPNFKNLLADATDVFDITPRIGTEIHGINLGKLTDAQKNDLARLLATRGVVFFRDQKDFGIPEQRALGSYFGVLHKV
ncbi:alpha-ketoglutarate-dependent taurine dioxygenase [Ascosphaera apis ARSEF 7405]|uniref:Alpha-ketoglutarate-dependent taurine dioxygenase n=1 Tax=Ascosphaera apis ARSEF 7405 TaxID=392613 RepID=A0A167XQT5_9EURO|nr:alpha-ketoglutarate-dependent taurine dioxygenase [Ascosphaera apis ARSEF 7405]